MYTCYAYTTGVYLSQNGTIIPNNSNLTITLIGQSDAEALLCLTDLYQFSNSRDSDDFEKVGNWYFSTNNSVVGNSIQSDVYTSRGQGVVRLHRKQHVTVLTGRFCCEILNANRTKQNICVQVTGSDDTQYGNTTTNNNNPTSPESSNLPVVGGAVVGGLLAFAVGFLLICIAIFR